LSFSEKNGFSELSFVARNIGDIFSLNTAGSSQSFESSGMVTSGSDSLKDEPILEEMLSRDIDPLLKYSPIDESSRSSKPFPFYCRKLKKKICLFLFMIFYFILPE
jgi:hypothetical protein